MGSVRLISAADALCGSHAFQHNFSSSSRKGAHSVRNSWFHSNLLAEYIKSLGVRTVKNIADHAEYASASCLLFTKSGSGAA
jgi:hypothetical protein